jgi:hypothetical protein
MWTHVETCDMGEDCCSCERPIPAPDWSGGARHLHWSADDERTVCGGRRFVPVRSGSRVFGVTGHRSVHWSKARKSDCPACRALVRVETHDRYRRATCPH